VKVFTADRRIEVIARLIYLERLYTFFLNMMKGDARALKCLPKRARGDFYLVDESNDAVLTHLTPVIVDSVGSTIKRRKATISP
jgi:hypothetical protein